MWHVNHILCIWIISDGDWMGPDLCFVSWKRHSWTLSSFPSLLQRGKWFSEICWSHNQDIMWYFIDPQWENVRSFASLQAGQGPGSEVGKWRDLVSYSRRKKSTLKHFHRVKKENLLVMLKSFLLWISRQVWTYLYVQQIQWSFIANNLLAFKRNQSYPPNI